MATVWVTTVNSDHSAYITVHLQHHKVQHEDVLTDQSHHHH